MARAENLVIMFTDIVGFTEMMSTQSRQENDTMLSRSESLLVGVAKKFGGRRIKSIGDALLLVFKSPTDAVHCAMAMHDALWERNQSVPNEREKISIRVSLNSGEVQLKSGDVFGEPVNVAARLEGMTPPNEVYFTEAIYLSMNKAEVSHELVGRHELRGIPEKVTIYRVPRGASAQRLVAIGSEDEFENQYPFGGMHRIDTHQPNQFLNYFSEKQTIIGAIALIVFAVAISAALFWPSDDQSRAQSNELLTSNNSVAPQAEPIEILPDDSDGALAQFMQGHINFEKGHYKAAFELYQQAISKQPSLANDERYVKNMLHAELEELLSGNDLVGLEARLTEMLPDDPGEALALLMQGHVSFEKGDHKTAYELYQRAISKQADLANDERYVKNLLHAELQKLLARNDLVALEARLTEVLADDPDEPFALFIQGHTAAEKRRYKTALQFYQRAISQQANLANDQRYATNLVRAMPSNGGKVTELAKLSPSKAVIDELALRSIGPGIKGRRDAANILTALDRADRVDSVAKSILDLRESTSCGDKKSALLVLKQYKDPRALPAIQEIISGSMMSRLKRNCYMKEAKETGAAIEDG